MQNVCLMNSQSNLGLLLASCFIFCFLTLKKIKYSSFMKKRHHLHRLHLCHDFYHHPFNAHLAIYRASHYLRLDQSSFYFLSLFCQIKMYHIFWNQRLKHFCRQPTERLQTQPFGRFLPNMTRFQNAVI